MTLISITEHDFAGMTGLTADLYTVRRELLESNISITETSADVFEGTSSVELKGTIYVLHVYSSLGVLIARKSYRASAPPPTHQSEHMPDGTEDQMLRHNGTEFAATNFANIVHSVANDLQGYYTYITDFYDDSTVNATQELVEEVWTDLAPQVYYDTKKLPDEIADEHVANGGNPFLDANFSEFSLGGCGSDTTHLVRTLLRFDPEEDESQLDFRLFCTTNDYTQSNGGITDFTIEKQGLVMTQGADRWYSDEVLIAFYTGGSLQGYDRDSAGSFRVQVKGTTAGTLEVQALTVTMSL